MVIQNIQCTSSALAHPVDLSQFGILRVYYLINRFDLSITFKYKINATY